MEDAAKLNVACELPVSNPCTFRVHSQEVHSF
ncbi:MAG: hypothetical protein QOJ00_1327 [Actinomycetota bacterium]|jgi:hypothetical protein